jgi:serine/threonine protein kinase
MGQVWLAEQISPVLRPVALKLIRAGMYDETVLRRFQSERQSLAIMDHPAIAKVFDAGATPQGQPYFVTEYVPGCRSRSIAIRKDSRFQTGWSSLSRCARGSSTRTRKPSFIAI